MAIHALDSYYLALTLLITIGFQTFFFIIAWSFKFDKLTDLAGGTNFLLLSLITFLFSLPSFSTRALIASLFLAIWSLRLSLFLFYRILRTGSDTRFDDKRNDIVKFGGFWIFQAIWVWTVSLPVTILNSPAVNEHYKYSQHGRERGSARATDIVGIIMFAIGFLVESWADVTKYRFKMRDEQLKQEGEVCDKGAWKWSRHPNYWGEIFLQFGIYLIAVTPATTSSVTGGPRAALYASIVGPLFLTCLLLFVSGLTLQERPAAKKRYEKGGKTWDMYKTYLDRTSILWPIPPVIYAKLPRWIKRTILGEWPIYRFDPVKHGVGSDEERLQNE